tara:strand:- start:44 stop:274 length:231 start_codon:yes stop_codon:yes gene_type:complete
MSILNARYVMDENGPDPRPHVEIVYADKVKYAGGVGDDGWDELQAWVSAGNTILPYEEITTIEKGTPAWVASVRSS